MTEIRDLLAEVRAHLDGAEVLAERAKTLNEPSAETRRLDVLWSRDWHIEKAADILRLFGEQPPAKPARNVPDLPLFDLRPLLPSDQ